MYQHGQGVPVDYQEALKLYRRGAKQGHAQARFNLGSMHAQGLGVEMNKGKALTFYRKAADQGHVAAQHNIGLMFLNGEGTEQSNEAAAKYFHRAAEQGARVCGRACACCGGGGSWVLVLEGRQQLETKWRAVHPVMYNLLSCLNVPRFPSPTVTGFADAQYNLGYSYEHGRGVTKHMARALQYYLLAGEQGHDQAAWALGILYEWAGVPGQATMPLHSYPALTRDRMMATKFYRIGKRHCMANLPWYLELKCDYDMMRCRFVPDFLIYLAVGSMPYLEMLIPTSVLSQEQWAWVDANCWEILPWIGQVIFVVVGVMFGVFFFLLLFSILDSIFGPIVITALKWYVDTKPFNSVGSFFWWVLNYPLPIDEIGDGLIWLATSPIKLLDLGEATAKRMSDGLTNFDWSKALTIGGVWGLVQGSAGLVGGALMACVNWVGRLYKGFMGWVRRREDEAMAKARAAEETLARETEHKAEALAAAAALQSKLEAARQVEEEKIASAVAREEAADQKLAVATSAEERLACVMAKAEERVAEAVAKAVTAERRATAAEAKIAVIEARAKKAEALHAAEKTKVGTFEKKSGKSESLTMEAVTRAEEATKNEKAARKKTKAAEAAQKEAEVAAAEAVARAEKAEGMLNGAISRAEAAERAKTKAEEEGKRDREKADSADSRIRELKEAHKGELASSEGKLGDRVKDEKQKLLQAHKKLAEAEERVRELESAAEDARQERSDERAVLLEKHQTALASTRSNFDNRAKLERTKVDKMRAERDSVLEKLKTSDRSVKELEKVLNDAEVELVASSALQGGVDQLQTELTKAHEAEAAALSKLRAAELKLDEAECVIERAEENRDAAEGEVLIRTAGLESRVDAAEARTEAAEQAQKAQARQFEEMLAGEHERQKAAVNLAVEAATKSTLDQLAQARIREAESWSRLRMEEESLSDAETRADMAEDRVHELEQQLERLEARLADGGVSSNSSQSSSPVSSTSEEGVGNGSGSGNGNGSGNGASLAELEALRNELAEANFTNSTTLGEVVVLKAQLAAAEARADDLENGANPYDRLNDETFG